MIGFHQFKPVYVNSFKCVETNRKQVVRRILNFKLFLLNTFAV